MIEDSVVVIRIKSGPDVIGLFCGEDVKRHVVTLCHPHYTKIDNETDNLLLMKYCYLTEETYFEFNRNDIEFLALVKPSIEQYFKTMIMSRDSLDDKEDRPNASNVIHLHKGNESVN